MKNPPAMQETWVGKISWRMARQPAPVFSPGNPNGQRKLVGCSPWARKELNTTERLNTATQHSPRVSRRRGREGTGPKAAVGNCLSSSPATSLSLPSPRLSLPLTWAPGMPGKPPSRWCRAEGLAEWWNKRACVWGRELLPLSHLGVIRPRGAARLGQGLA